MVKIMTNTYNRIDQLFDMKSTELNTLPLYVWIQFDITDSFIQRMISIEISWHMRTGKKLTDYELAMNIHIKKNKFISKEDKLNIENILYRATRRRYLAKKYLHKWIFKSKNYFYKDINSSDLMLQDFDSENIIYIYENLNRFKFTPCEFHKIIVNNILSSNHQIPVIKETKNEYTQRSLTKNQLYNIYINIKLRNIKCSWLLDEYVKFDFDSSLMLNKHHSYLKTEAIKNDVIHMDDSEFRTEVENLLQINIMDGIFQNVDGYIINIKNIATSNLRRKFTIPIINEYEISFYESMGLFSLSYWTTYINILKGQNKKIVFDFWHSYPEIILNPKVKKNLDEKERIMKRKKRQEKKRQREHKIRTKKKHQIKK